MSFASFFKTYRTIILTIAVGYLFVLASLAYVGTQINQTITDLGTQTSELYQHPFRVNAAAREARLAASRIRNELLFALADHDKVHTNLADEMQPLDATLDRNLITIETFFLGDMTKVREARELVTAWRKERTHLIILLTEGRRAEAEKVVMAKTNPLYESLIPKLDFIVEFSSMKARFFAEQAQQKSAASLDRFYSLSLALTIMIVLAGGMTVFVALNALRRRDQQIVEQQKVLRRFEAIVKSTDDAIISKTLDGIIESWNDGAVNVFGYSAEEAIGHPMEMLIPPDRLNEESGIIARIARGERVEHFETVRRHKNGRLINISVSISPIIDGVGNVIGASKIARDFTEHHKAEIELRIAAAAFEAQEGIVVTDLQDVVMRVNQAFTRITRYPAEEAIGSKMNFLKSGRHDETFYNGMWAQLSRSGEWQGEIWNRRKDGEIHPYWVTITSVKDNKGAVINYVGTYTDITERKRAAEEIRQLAYHDMLTKLPNRRLLNDRLQQAMASSARRQNYGALMFLDLDNFKPLNDMHGHEAGDQLLIEASNRLTSCVREMDTVARFGGDEFVVMISELDTDKADSTAQAESIAEKIRTTLSTPYHLMIKRDQDFQANIEHHCTASIGVTLFIGNEATQDEILKWADDAMYQAKEAGRNLIRFYASTS